jgi:exodeoxyribonuclease V alpha subunit
MEFSGVSFRTADAIALRLGHAPDEPARQEAALLHTIAAAARDDGHTVMERGAAIAAAASLLGNSERNAAAALDAMLARGALSATGPDVGKPDLVAAEARLAASFADRLERMPGGWRIADDESPHDDDSGYAEIDAIGKASGIVFDPTQRTAIRNAVEAGVTVLTGGPGTGKTTIVKAICDLAERRGQSVALMSFTGKAAKRLSEATGRKATTIHRYLRFVPGQGFLGPATADDLVIVDEASMLDVPLADDLVSRLAPSARILMVGDVDQLPAIGPGNVLGDLADAGAVPVFRLMIIHRTDDASGIPLLAKAIREGSEDLPFDRVTTRMIERWSPGDISDWVRAHFERYRGRADEFQVLAPIKAGSAGVEALNGVIARVIRGDASSHGYVIERENYDMCAGDRIIWTVNDREMGLFNGEIGTLVAVTRGGGAIVEFNGERFTIVRERVSAGVFMLSYVLTVHKFQGSEAPVIIFITDFGASSMLYRRLIYTAVSRARNTVAVVGQPPALAAGVARHDDEGRRTSLGRLLREALA